MAGKELTGVLFKNENRSSEKHPLYKGSCVVDGVEYWIASWINEHAEKGKYMSLKFEAKQKPQEQTPREKQRQAVKAGDDDVPL